MTSSINDWISIKQKLQETLTPEQFANWIDPLKVKSSSEHEIVLLIPNMVFYQGILDEYLDKIEFSKSLLNIDHLLIRFEIENAQNSDCKIPAFPGQIHANEHVEQERYDFHDHEDLNTTTFLSQNDRSQTTQQLVSGNTELEHIGYAAQKMNLPITNKVPTSPRLTVSKSLSSKSGLNPNYVFENFVKGPSNQFCYATCLNVAENPGKTYNPLFIYGATGLGKTHLMHAVGNKIQQLNPDAIITYISSERFMNEMIYSLRFNKMWDFRQKYRHCDILLVDDIQFFSMKKATQEEFFHTFNSLYENKKQIIITSDMFPQEIPDIEERLRNRFQWGLIADIQPPDMEHRIAILLNKADQLNIHLSNDVAEYIATHAKKNVRELEGALHRLTAYASLHGRSIDMSIVLEIFQNVLSEPQKRLSIDTILKTVADFYKIKVIDIKGKKRQKALTMPRQIAMYLSRNLTKASFPEIGEKFGGKDHTTVMHAVKKVTQDLTADLELRSNIESIERQLDQLL